MESIVTLDYETWERERSQVGKWGLSGHQLELLSGFSAGVAGIISGHPLDTVRIRQQTSSTRDGVFSILSKMVRKEGWTSPLRGIASPLAASGFQNALLFATYAPSHRLLASDNSPVHVSSHLGQVFLAGCIAGAAQTVVTAPSELVKIRMQASGSQYASNTQCMVAAVRAHGVRHGLFRGFGVTFLRDCPNIGLYFLSYEWVKGLLTGGQLLVGDAPVASNATVLLAGGTAGILSWALSYPIDVVKTRLQADTTGQYRGAWHALKLSVQQHGYRVLFQGFSACMYRAFVVNAVTFVAFEEARRRLSL